MIGTDLFTKEQKRVFNKLRQSVRDASYIAKVEYSTEIAFDCALYAVRHYTNEIVKVGRIITKIKHKDFK